MYEIGNQEMEIGMGIHGEKGRLRTHIKSAKEIVGIVIDAFLNKKLKKNDKVVLVVNNLGSCTDLEMNILSIEFINQL